MLNFVGDKTRSWEFRQQSWHPRIASEARQCLRETPPPVHYELIYWYGRNTTRHLPTKQGEIKLIPFEFTIKLPNTELFGNKPKVLL